MANVCVLTGGRSLERSVSLRSADRVERALRELGHTPTVIDIAPDLVERLQAGRHDIAFVCAHGSGGEDGTVQELCELVGLPYTGAGVSASIRCFDKVLLKHELRDARLPTPGWASFSQETFTELGAAGALPAVVDRLGLPLIVKPARCGSALGITVARSQQELRAGLVTALGYDSKAVVEVFLEGARDLAVSVLGSPQLRTLPIVEAHPRQRELYDFDARYTPGQTEFTVPAALPDGAVDRARRLALQACLTMGVKAFGRVDMLLAGDELYVIDLATVPGLTETSLVPMAAEAAGIGFEQLVAEVLESAPVGSAR